MTFKHLYLENGLRKVFQQNFHGWWADLKAGGSENQFNAHMQIHAYIQMYIHMCVKALISLTISHKLLGMRTAAAEIRTNFHNERENGTHNN